MKTKNRLTQSWLNKLTGLAIISSLAAIANENESPFNNYDDAISNEEVTGDQLPRLLVRNRFEIEANDIMDLIENGGVIEHTSPLISFRIEEKVNGRDRTFIVHGDVEEGDIYTAPRIIGPEQAFSSEPVETASQIFRTTLK